MRAGLIRNPTAYRNRGARLPSAPEGLLAAEPGSHAELEAVLAGFADAGVELLLIESGDGKAMLLDFNYDTEPLPGRFPLPGIGPFTLLEESEVHHWGKRAFRWVYWNVLLRGKELPLDHRMLMAGKRTA